MKSRLPKVLLIAAIGLLSSNSPAQSQSSTPTPSPKTLTQSGGIDAGGGNALVCFKTAKSIEEIKKNRGYVSDRYLSEINFIESFDLYEAKKSRGFVERTSQPNAIIPIDDREDIPGYVQRILARTEKIYPSLYQALKNEFKRISGHRTILTNDRLEQVYDVASADYVDRKNCLYATLAAQVTAGPTTTVYLDNKLFNHPLHSRLSKAVLMLHEVIYSFLRKSFQHTDSRLARFLVTDLISENTSFHNLDLTLDSQKGMPGQLTWYWSFPDFDGHNGIMLNLMKSFGSVQSKDGHVYTIKTLRVGFKSKPLSVEDCTKDFEFRTVGVFQEPLILNLPAGMVEALGSHFSFLPSEHVLAVLQKHITLQKSHASPKEACEDAKLYLGSDGYFVAAYNLELQFSTGKFMHELLKNRETQLPVIPYASK